VKNWFFEAVEATEVHEAWEISKAWKITTVDFRVFLVLELLGVISLYFDVLKKIFILTE
jgi:hypothetical protein